MMSMSSTSNAVRRIPTPTTAEMTNIMWIGLAAGYIMLLAGAMTRLSYDVWGGLVLMPVLGGISLPLMRRSIRKDGQSMLNIITVAFLAKMVGTIVRYYVTFEVYGTGDATGYHGAGSRLAAGFWDGSFSEVYQTEIPKLVGTDFMRLTTGLLYIVTGPTKLGGFVAYSVLSFWGLFFFYKALRTAFPDADYRRYAVLLFFLPSLLYWPSSIGKEAWMCFTIGLTTYGVALILQRNPIGYPFTGFGLFGSAMVRPHITALCVASLLFAYVLRRRSWRESASGPFGKWIGIGVMLLVGGFVLGQVATFFKLDDIDSSSVDTVLTSTEEQSGQGGSEFETTKVGSPAGYPMAAVTVLFRPFPWEAGNANAASAAVEGFVLAVVCLSSWRRLIRVPGFVFRVPYLSYCLAYAAMFIFAFSSIGNFGILSRQRTQVFPLVLVLLVVPPPRIDDGDDLIDDGRRITLSQVPRRGR